MPGLSFLKNIDFANPGNLISFAIFLVIAAIILFIFISVATGIIKMIRRLVIRVFDLDVKKPKFDQKNSRDKAGSQEPIFVPRPRIMGGDSINNFDSKEEKEPEKNSEQKYEERPKGYPEKDIAEGLNRLKSVGVVHEDTLESKMPLRSENQPEISGYDEIKIPRARRPEEDVEAGQIVPGQASSKVKISDDFYENFKDSDLHSHPLDYEEEKIENTGGILQEQKEGAMRAKEKITADKVVPSGRVKQDNSIFSGEPEVSRMKLEHQMKTDPRVWQAARQEGLTLSPIERAKLVKEVFAPSLGRNISKADLRQGVRKLNQKMLGIKDPGEHAKIRKEIRFFKKIGGIK